jgi:hypothetical protein
MSKRKKSTEDKVLIQFSKSLEKLRLLAETNHPELKRIVELGDDRLASFAEVDAHRRKIETDVKLAGCQNRPEAEWPPELRERLVHLIAEYRSLGF